MYLIDLLDQNNKKQFYNSYVFHERQMNSCPIGCAGCAVSAVTNAKGSIKYEDLYKFYEEAHSFGVSLKLTKVEGYDPVFVSYADDPQIPFARSVQDAINFGHTIITPVCTTGSWKAERTKWQLEELGKLDNSYRYYQYPSGNSGVGFTLSVPREINPYSNDRYNFDEHITKLLMDIKLLTANGNLDVLIYYNSLVEGDFDLAVKIKSTLVINSSQDTLARTNFQLVNFNAETLPESCFRYPNSVLISDKGFTGIDAGTMEWETDPNLITTQDLFLRLASVK